jgi:hypothetical protein
LHYGNFSTTKFYIFSILSFEFQAFWRVTVARASSVARSPASIVTFVGLEATASLTNTNGTVAAIVGSNDA